MNRTSAPFTRLRRESRWANDKNGFGLAAQPGDGKLGFTLRSDALQRFKYVEGPEYAF